MGQSPLPGACSPHALVSAENENETEGGIGLYSYTQVFYGGLALSFKELDVKALACSVCHTQANLKIPVDPRWPQMIPGLDDIGVL